MSLYKEVVFPIVSHFDPESTHDTTIQLLKIAEKYRFIREFLERIYSCRDPRLNVTTWGLHFENPLGLAAGFDKNAVAPRALGALGFGHVEIGTVTPKFQRGNERPRIFRLSEDKALINRMGFPGLAMEEVLDNLANTRERKMVLGVNAGANKRSVDEGRGTDDYVEVLINLAAFADYLVINVSSPNTARLRELQGKEALRELIGQVRKEMDERQIVKPLLLKIAPDFENSEREIGDIVDTAMEFGVNGIIATNTTVSREELTSTFKNERGGLSGRPLVQKSLDTIRTIYKISKGTLPIVGVGGVFNAEDVVRKMQVGASLIQVYTGLVYEGPGMIKTINKDLVVYIEREGLDNISEIVGTAI